MTYHWPPLGWLRTRPHAGNRKVVVTLFKVSLMLADHAQAVGGKLYISGGGWSITGPDASPSAIAMDMKIPWDLRTEEHNLRLELVDSDGQSVLVPTPQGVQPLVIDGQLKIEGPFDGIKPGTPLDAPFALNLGPIPIPPGGRYEWRLSINGESHEDWRLAFSTRPAVAQAA
jgi:hypothetical protein